MGVLAPLFFAALAGISLPIVFHLIRRTPTGRQQFSSLMFLTPTPPRLTRRSRLDQLLLLILRATAFGLLAFAFARPFLRETSLLSLNDLPRRRVAILVDATASMRRADVWQQAIAAALQQVDELAPHDDIALFTFSDRLATVVPFPAKDVETANVTAAQVVRERLRKLEPSWASGDLGKALVASASELDAASDVRQSLVEPQLVVISDFQSGNRLDALQGFEWPDRVRLVPKPLTAARTTNASLKLVVSADAAPGDPPRVRVANAADSKEDQFFLRWSSETTAATKDGETAVYVPPGQTRVVRVPRPTSGAATDRIILRGDDHDFDNTCFVVPPLQQKIDIRFVGSDKDDDPQGFLYYLRLAVSGDPLRDVKLSSTKAENLSAIADPVPSLIVIASRLPSNAIQSLRQFVEQGGSLMMLAAERELAESLPALMEGIELRNSPAGSKDDFALLSDIDFTHPLFAPFANPRYNDFTRIHFWRHERLAIRSSEATHVVARFDDGSPWLLERRLGKGRIWAFTSGWRPDDSQLAVSSKFVPLIGSFLDQASGAVRESADFVVHQAVPISGDHRESVTVENPRGEKVTLIANSEYQATSFPGIYRATAGKDDFRFAVNLAPAESETAPIAMDQLRQFGVRIGSDATKAERLQRIRQARDVELEGRQQVWRWLLAGCMIILIAETFLAGRIARVATAAAKASV